MSSKKIAHSVLILIAPMLFVGCGGYANPPSMPPAIAPQLALVANSISNSISIYAVNPQTGELKPKEMVPTGGVDSKVMALDGAGRFAYVGNVASNDISVFAIDAKTGHLSMVGSPVPGGQRPTVHRRGADREYSLCSEPAIQQHHWLLHQS
jgi:DNA-binding beta-propeller fold protein YncE